MAFKIVRPLGRSDTYSVPELFPQIHRYVGPRRRQYVEETMVELAKAGTLCVTDLMNQAQPVADLAGQVILGQEIIDHKQKLGKRVPRELSTYQVRVRSLNGETVKWCRDMVPGAPIQKGRAEYYDGQDKPLAAYRVMEEWVDTEQCDVMLDLPDAWLCLRQTGKFCRRCPREARQAKEWKCEEVRPEPKGEEPAKPERGKRGAFAPAVG